MEMENTEAGLKTSNISSFEREFATITMVISMTMLLIGIARIFKFYQWVRKDELSDANTALKILQSGFVDSFYMLGIVFTARLVYTFLKSEVNSVFVGGIFPFFYSLDASLKILLIFAFTLIEIQLLMKSGKKGYKENTPLSPFITAVFYLVSFKLFYEMNPENGFLVNFGYNTTCPFAFFFHICYFIVLTIILKRALEKCHGAEAKQAQKGSCLEKLLLAKLNKSIKY